MGEEWGKTKSLNKKEWSNDRARCVPEPQKAGPAPWAISSFEGNAACGAKAGEAGRTLCWPNWASSLESASAKSPILAHRRGKRTNWKAVAWYLVLLRRHDSTWVVRSSICFRVQRWWFLWCFF